MVQNLDDEREFFQRYYRYLLIGEGVTAKESIYVDDYKPEADGAREQSFTSFLIDRSSENKDEWTVTDLRQLIDFEKTAF